MLSADPHVLTWRTLKRIALRSGEEFTFDRTDKGRSAMQTELEMIDLGDAMEETRQASTNPRMPDSVFVFGWPN